MVLPKKLQCSQEGRFRANTPSLANLQLLSKGMLQLLHSLAVPLDGRVGPPHLPLSLQVSARKQAQRAGAEGLASSQICYIDWCDLGLLCVTGTIAAQPPAAPSGGLAGLVSRVSNAARQSGSRPSSAGASLQYMFHKQQRDYAKLIQQNELILAEAPFYDVAKSGVASFAYFEPGFMTQPFRCDIAASHQHVLHICGCV